MSGMRKKKFLLSREFRLLYILIILFRLSLDLAYEYVISVKFRYMGLENNKSIVLTVLSWVVLVIYMVIGKQVFDNYRNRLSKEIVYCMFLMSFVPFTSLMKYGILTVLFVVCNLMYWCLLFFCVGRIRIKQEGLIRTKEKRFVNDVHIQILTVFSFLVILFISGRYTGFRFHFSLLDVYDLRNEARSFNLPIILGYLFTWTRTTNSILEAYFIRRKKWAWAVACFVIQLLSFGVDGSKTTLFLAIFAIVINIVPKIEIRALNLWILYGAIIVTALCTGVSIFANNIIPASLFVRRIFFIPAYIQTCYFDFFTKHVPDYFRNSFMRYFGLQSPYSNIPFLIGSEYFNQNSMSANNGLISDAVANLGYVGILVMPILLSFILKLMDKASEGLDVRLYLTVALYTSLILVNSFLFTVLLTHGLMVVIILLKLMNRDYSELALDKR